MTKTKVKRVYVHHGRYVFIQDLLERNPKTGKPKQQQHGLTRVSEGEAAMHKALAALLETLNTERKAGSMVRLINEWKANKEFGCLKYEAETQKEYKRKAEILKAEFYDFNAPDVLPSDIAAFIDENFADKPNTANKYKAIASLIFSFGVRKGYRADNPCRDLQNYQEGGRSRYITDEELAAIRKGLRIGKDGKPTKSGEMMVCLVDLAAVTGQRHGDLITLKWSQISDKGILFHPSKTKGSTGVKVPVALTPQLKSILDRVKSIQGVRSMEYVIHTMDGRPYTYSGANSAWTRACERADVKDANFHDLKHKALTDAERQKLDPQRLGGHSDPKMTKKYLEDIGIIDDADWIQPPVIGGIS